MSGLKDKKKRLKFSAERTSKADKAYEVDRSNIKDESGEHEENRVGKMVRNKKRKNSQAAERETVKRDETHEGIEDGFTEENLGVTEVQQNLKRKQNKKKSKREKKARLNTVDTETKDNCVQQKDDKKLQTTPGTPSEVENSEELCKTELRTSFEPRMSKKTKKKSKNTKLSKGKENLLQKADAEEDEVYQISSGDEDCSKGLNKWIMEYHQRRPGLNVLQERIDEFITAHEACEEQERKEREARAAEDGWTVVTHHKGRKKTTDVETGVAVGSVAQTAVLNKMAKKKSKGSGLDFYRFQKREARKNEIMVLQNKFEEDKKKIQQLRAARKFRPY